MLTELKERQPENVAIVVIPSRRNDSVGQTSFPTFVLDRQNDWLASTPIVVKLSEGICIVIGKRLQE